MTIEKFIEIRRKETGRKVLLADARKFVPVHPHLRMHENNTLMRVHVSDVERYLASFKSIDKDKKYKFKILTRYFDSEGNLRKEKSTNAN